MKTKCDYQIESNNDTQITIRDLNLGNMSVTNDAEAVVQTLINQGYLKNDKKLFYYDSTNTLDEIVWKPGKRVDFKPVSGVHNTQAKNLKVNYNLLVNDELYCKITDIADVNCLPTVTLIYTELNFPLLLQKDMFVTIKFD